MGRGASQQAVSPHTANSVSGDTTCAGEHPTDVVCRASARARVELPVTPLPDVTCGWYRHGRSRRSGGAPTTISCCRLLRRKPPGTRRLPAVAGCADPLLSKCSREIPPSVMHALVRVNHASVPSVIRHDLMNASGSITCTRITGPIRHAGSSTRSVNAEKLVGVTPSRRATSAVPIHTSSYISPWRSESPIGGGLMATSKRRLPWPPPVIGFGVRQGVDVDGHIRTVAPPQVRGTVIAGEVGSAVTVAPPTPPFIGERNAPTRRAAMRGDPACRAASHIHNEDGLVNRRCGSPCRR